MRSRPVPPAGRLEVHEREAGDDRAEPAEMPKLIVGQERLTALELLRVAHPDASNSELRRLLRQGAVSVDGVRGDDPAAVDGDPGAPEGRTPRAARA